MDSGAIRISSKKLIHRNKFHLDEFFDIKSDSRLESIIDIVIIFLVFEYKCIFYSSLIYYTGCDRSDREAHMVEESSELHKESHFVMKNTLNLENNTRIPSIITPFCEHTSLEFYFFDIFTTHFVNGDYSLTNRSDDFAIFWSWFTAFCDFVWYISRFSYNYIDSCFS